MKRKIILPVVICLILLLVGCGKEKVAESKPYMATLDINPAIELEIDGDKAKRIGYLDGDAEELVSRDFEGKSLNEVFDEVLKNAKDKGLIEQDELTVIVGIEEKSNGNDRKMVQDYLQEACDRNKIHVDIIIPEITEEAKHEAEGYNVTPAKAAVILEATKGKDDVHFEDFTERTAKELKEIKETGLYCERDYTLRDGKCEKAIKEENAIEGKTCPENYQKYKDKCYKVSPSMHEPSCKKDMELVEGKCVGKEEVAAKAANYTCSKGTAMTRYEAGLTGKNAGDAKDIVCVDTSNATHPMSPCEAGKAGDGTEYLESGGKCYWHRAGVLPEGCPGKIKVGDSCWDDASNILICKGARDGKRYSSRSEYCEGSVKYTNPTVSEYKCDSGYTLEGKKCIKEVTKEPTLKIACADGLISYEDRACLNPKDVAEFVIGYTCPSEARLENNKCVYYEVVDAK